MDRPEYPEPSSPGRPGDPRGSHPSAAPPGGPHRGRRRWITVGAVIFGVGLLTALFGFGLGRDPSVIRFKQIGPSSYEVLTDQIQALLDQGG